MWLLERTYGDELCYPVGKMQELLNILNSFLSFLGPIGLTLILCLGTGYIIRLTPIHNKWIPFLQPLIGAVIGGVILPLIAPTDLVPETYQKPTIVLIIYGFIIGMISSILHKFIIKRIEVWAREKFPSLNEWFENTSDSNIHPKE